MDDSKLLATLAGGTALVVVAVVLIAGPAPTEAQGPPPAPPPKPPVAPAPPPPLPDKFQTISEARLERAQRAAEAVAQAPEDSPLPEAEPDKARPELDVRLGTEVVAKGYREAFEGRASEWRRAAPVTAAGYEGWFGGPGQEPGQFAYPRAIAVNPDGRLFVVDKSGRIQRYDAEGRLEVVVRTPEIDKGKPTGIGLSKSGRLLVADTHYARVLTYSAELELLSEFGADGPEPGHFLFVTDVCEGPDGRIYVTDYGDLTARVQIFSASGEYLHGFGTFGAEPGQFQRPMALAIDEARGELLVADAVNHRIQVFDLEGAFVRILGSLGGAPGELKYPYDVAVDEEGRVWVAEFGNHRVQVLGAITGESLGVIGVAGRRLGEVAFPWGVGLTVGGRYYLLDSGNDRIYVGSREVVLRSRERGS